MLGAVTMTSAAEALGVSLAAHRVGLQVAISFTLETDGRLPSGESLEEAIEKVDGQSPPTYVGINCAHPSHWADALAENRSWTRHMLSVRANASTGSHAELDASPDLDMGNPHDLAQRYRGLKSVLPKLGVLRGCCGTDWRHLRAIRDAWTQRPSSARS
ncbi:MAG: homocysteine S-methyltransferase family protein [Hydrogenophaga sp.]|nr:homocysteine S-methyltransferase family protein [Hydrogenophaga sp.]